MKLGASIDESTIQHVVQVSLGAAPGGDGSAGQPFASIVEAWPTVMRHLDAGEPTKLIALEEARRFRAWVEERSSGAFGQ